MKTVVRKPMKSQSKSAEKRLKILSETINLINQLLK